MPVQPKSWLNAISPFCIIGNVRESHIAHRPGLERHSAGLALLTSSYSLDQHQCSCNAQHAGSL
jgi:hypothetical protein